jgi:hypothetical protein
VSASQSQAFDRLFSAALAAEKHLHGTEDPDGKRCASALRDAIHAVMASFTPSTEDRA